MNNYKILVPKTESKFEELKDVYFLKEIENKNIQFTRYQKLLNKIRELMYIAIEKIDSKLSDNYSLERSIKNVKNSSVLSNYRKPIEYTTFNISKLNEQDIVNEIFKYKKNIDMYIYQQPIDTVIVGNYLFNKIQKSDYNSPFSFHLEHDITLNYIQNENIDSSIDPKERLNTNYQSINLNGLKIICIPWFDGILLLNKNNL